MANYAFIVLFLLFLTLLFLYCCCPVLLLPPHSPRCVTTTLILTATAGPSLWQMLQNIFLFEMVPSRENCHNEKNNSMFRFFWPVTPFGNESSQKPRGHFCFPLKDTWVTYSVQLFSIEKHSKATALLLFPTAQTKPTLFCLLLHLDYCKAVCSHWSQEAIAHLQVLQHSALPLPATTPQCSHVFLVLLLLHWLPVKYRLKSKSY